MSVGETDHLMVSLIFGSQSATFSKTTFQSLLGDILKALTNLLDGIDKAVADLLIRNPYLSEPCQFPDIRRLQFSGTLS